VLLVEDEPGVRDYVMRALKVSGYQVVSFSNGAEALRHVEAGKRVDVIVSDVVMPQMSGPELLERVKRLLPGIGVVLVSGYPQRLDKNLFINEEVLLLAKPFTTDQLTQALRKVIHASKVRQASTG
jgi:two-component system cell cycle sensor histidine kinase/response regulator CckA